MLHVIESLNQALIEEKLPILDKVVEDRVMYYWKQILWKHCRVFIIAWFKEHDNDECLLPNLPFEIIRLIVSWVDWSLVYQTEHSNWISRSNYMFPKIYLSLSFDNTDSDISLTYFIDPNNQYIEFGGQVSFHSRYNKEWLNYEPALRDVYFLDQEEELEVILEGCSKFFNRDVTWKQIDVEENPDDYCIRALAGTKQDEDLIVVQYVGSDMFSTSYYLHELGFIFTFFFELYDNVQDEGQVKLLRILESCLKENKFR